MTRAVGVGVHGNRLEVPMTHRDGGEHGISLGAARQAERCVLDVDAENRLGHPGHPKGSAHREPRVRRVSGPRSIASTFVERDFLGRDALLQRAEPSRRMVCLVLDDPRSVALGEEPVRVDGAITGRVTSGGFGYTVGRSIAYAYLPADRTEAGTRVEVEIFGEWVSGEVAPEPLFDPAGERLRG